MAQQDVDVLSNLRGAPKAVKTALCQRFPDRYSGLTEDVFSVAISDTRKVQIDILSSDMVSLGIYHPSALHSKFGPALQFPPGYPLILRPLAGFIEGSENKFFASAFDLVIMKMFSAPLRSKGKQAIDLGDLQILIKKIQSTKSAAPPSYTEFVAKKLAEEKENHSNIFDSIESDLREVFGLEPSQ